VVEEKKTGEPGLSCLSNTVGRRGEGGTPKSLPGTKMRARRGTQVVSG